MARCSLLMSGPVWVCGSSGPPSLMARARSTIAFTTWSWISRCTRSRVPAEQTWPEWRNPAVTALSIAASRSASAKIIFGFLPPSSSAIFFTVLEAALMIFLPVMSPPVKETMSTRASAVRGWPTTAPEPRIRLATPLGSPDSSKSRIKCMALEGVSSLGLRMKLHPATRAGATFQEACRRG
ncbi:hypothetical protein GALL_536630 [mine drainage metagenome]|uniref:Uncharacterized protein n=1 Tax=mine drainage metagenome TaxID=410659 RepID=A0A1J5P2B1_9ZZZZ